MSRIIVLSPHFDDAVLSCGGLIAALSEKNRVEIWTVFTGTPVSGPYSPNALWLHGISGATSARSLSRIRRSEDDAACKVLGVRGRHFGFWDGPYRKRDDGTYLYEELRVPRPAHEDEGLILKIAAELRRNLAASDIVLAPLGVGCHVDHVVLNRVASMLPAEKVVYYVDLPYARSYPEEVLSLSAGFLGFDYEVSEVHQRAWADAVSRYASQLRMLGEEVGAVPDFIISAYDAGFCRLYATNFDTVPEVFKAVERRRVSRSTLAPIAIFAFNRLDLLEKTIAALEKSDGFGLGSIYIFSDAARAGRQDEARAVEEVRSWLDAWAIRVGATVIKASSNQGLRKSIIGGVGRVLEDHECVIVLEDDIIVAQSFLAFMNDALEANKDRTDVFQISGYFVPHKETLAHVGLLRAPGSWGWATWRRAWNCYNDDAAILLDEVRKADVFAFDMDGSYAYLEALEKNVTGELDTWSVRWYASMFLRRGLVIYPGQSLTRNIGFGERATNTLPEPMSKTFLHQPIEDAPATIDWRSLGHAESASFVKAMVDFYRWQHWQWVKPSWRERINARWEIVTGRQSRA